MKKNLTKLALTIVVMIMLVGFSQTSIYQQNYTPAVDKLICLLLAVVGFTALYFFFVYSYEIIRELKKRK